MLNEISTALESTGKTVFYGQAGKLDGSEVWDYIVFFRDTLQPSANKTGMTETYTVAIVQDEYVDDATIEAVLKAMLAIKGVRLSQNPSQFDYSVKPNTDVVLEMLTLSFTRPWKGLSANG